MWFSQVSIKLTAGKPASLTSSANLRVAKGVTSEDFITTMMINDDDDDEFQKKKKKKIAGNLTNLVMQKNLLVLPVANAGANFQAAIMVG